MRLVLPLAFILLAAPLPSHAREGGQDGGRDFWLVPWADVPVLALTASAVLLTPALDSGLARAPAQVLDRSAVNAFDRIATRQWSPAADAASDWLVAGSVGLALAGSVADVAARGRPAQEVLVDGVLVAESVLTTAAMTTLVKYSVRRRRPLAYNPAAPEEVRGAAGASLSFWSGHTSMAAAALTSFAWLRWRRVPGGVTGPIATAAAVAIVPAVGVLRVAAGRHYPTDVLAGAAAGAAVGVLVPWLHETRPGRGTTTVIRPLLGPDGDGVALEVTW